MRMRSVWEALACAGLVSSVMGRHVLEGFWAVAATVLPSAVLVRVALPWSLGHLTVAAARHGCLAVATQARLAAAPCPIIPFRTLAEAFALHPSRTCRRVKWLVLPVVRL